MKNFGIVNDMRYFLVGIMIGIANVIPGVSGGTIAVVCGVYDRLIEAISQFFSRKDQQLSYLRLLATIGVGSVVGIGVFAMVFQRLLDSFPQPTYSFFLGLILGSLPVIYRTHHEMTVTWSRIVSFCLGVSLVVYLSLSNPGIMGNVIDVGMTTKNSLLFFLSGVIAAAAMVVPGVSGSFILLLLGTYGAILQAVTSFNVSILALVGVGAAIGMIVVTKLIHYLLNHMPGTTYYGIMGLMVGSIIKLWPGYGSGLIFMVSVVSFLLGVGLTLYFEKRFS